MTDVVADVNILMGNIQLRFDQRCQQSSLVSMLVDDMLLKKLTSTLPAVKSEDLENVCEVAAFQQANDRWSIFIALDYKDIIDNARKIYEISKIHCADPLYSFTTLEELETLGRRPSQV
ncbi:MAG: hypothetical protein H3Z51_04920 [archaeon]|nr:hypothetical protein [archaeon]